MEQIPHFKRTEWVKGVLYSFYNKNRRCLLGHISILQFNPNGSLWRIGVQPEIERVMITVIKELFPERVDPDLGVISWFNDHPRTTYSDVCKVIEETNRRLMA